MFATHNTLQRGRGLVLRLIAGLLISASAVTAAAQDITSASIIGQVKDESGAVLPGVTVTATSPALQVPAVTAVTDTQGEYRLTPLPFGTYQVEYALSGFTTIKNDTVRLTAGFVAKLDVVMKVGTVTETVTVTGAGPVVDVTATKTTTVLTSEHLAVVPTSGFSFVSLVSEAPGAKTGTPDVGGSAIEPGGGGAFSFRTFGQVAESWQRIEGIVTESGKVSQGGDNIDNNSLEEVSVETVGANADVRTPGIAINAIVKSGSNTLHSAAYFTASGKKLESNNLTPALAAIGLTSHHTLGRYNAGVDLGGPIRQNKLWFYGAYAYRDIEFQLLSVLMPDGSVAASFRRQHFATGKISFQPDQNNRFTFFAQPNTYSGYTGVLTRFLPWESRTMQTCLGEHCLFGNPKKVEYQRTFGNSIAMSLQYGHWYWNSYKVCEDLKPATTDIGTQFNTGCDFSRHGDQQHEWNHHTLGNVSWYRPNLLAGNHEFKTGFDLVYNTIADNRIARPAAIKSYELVFNNGTPFQIYTQNSPLNTENPTHYLGIYGQDKWTLGRRLTLSVGLRYAHDNGFVPDQCREAGDFAPATCFPGTQFKIWNVFTPRVQAAYDLMGDGKTVVKGGWGRFAHERRADPEVISANRLVATSTVWRWHDNNNNKLYEPGEVNLDPNGPDFVTINALGSTASGTSFAVANPNEKEPKQDQYSLSFERQLVANLAVRVTGLYVHSFDNYVTQNNFIPSSAYTVAVTRPDPGPDGRAGTADDPGVNFTYYEFPTSLQGAQFVQGMLINPPGMDAYYKSYELAMTKRLSHHWLMLASYSSTNRDVPIQADSGAPPAANPNAFINTADRTREWVGRISGAYYFPANVVASINYQNLSGSSYARTVLFTGGVTIPSITLNVEPIGTQRNPTINLLDLRVEKRFRLPNKQQFSVRANVFNAANISTVTGVTSRSGASYRVPTSFINGRIMEIGANFSF
jgi:carboxypeptidase family protein